MPFKSDKQRKWMHSNKPEMAKRWEKKYAVGGYLEGNSHEDGGIDINVEGGEYIIPKDSVNPATLSTLEYIKIHGDVPMRNAKDRSK